MQGGGASQGLGAGPGAVWPEQQRQRRTKAGVLTKNITKEALSSVFHLPCHKACEALGVGLTIFKKICRRHGLDNWPYRALRKQHKAGRLGGSKDEPADRAEAGVATPPQLPAWVLQLHQQQQVKGLGVAAEAASAMDDDTCSERSGGVSGAPLEGGDAAQGQVHFEVLLAALAADEREPAQLRQATPAPPPQSQVAQAASDATLRASRAPEAAPPSSSWQQLEARVQPSPAPTPTPGQAEAAAAAQLQQALLPQALAALLEQQQAQQASAAPLLGLLAGLGAPPPAPGGDQPRQADQVLHEKIKNWQAAAAELRRMADALSVAAAAATVQLARDPPIPGPTGCPAASGQPIQLEPHAQLLQAAGVFPASLSAVAGLLRLTASPQPGGNASAPPAWQPLPAALGAPQAAAPDAALLAALLGGGLPASAAPAVPATTCLPGLQPFCLELLGEGARQAPLAALLSQVQAQALLQGWAAGPARSAPATTSGGSLTAAPGSPTPLDATQQRGTAPAQPAP